MFTNLYDLEATGTDPVHADQQTEIGLFILSDEFAVIPAYKEMLPDGLISDEV